MELFRLLRRQWLLYKWPERFETESNFLQVNANHDVAAVWARAKQPLNWAWERFQKNKELMQGIYNKRSNYEAHNILNHITKSMVELKILG